MHNYENTPIDWFTSGRRSRSSYYPPPMSKPVSKSFNRISDFIFPDTVHIRFPSSRHQQTSSSSISQRYQRIDNYSLPVLNQRDLVIVERLPAEELNNIDLLYREQHYQPNRHVRRRYSSIIDERHLPSNEKISAGLANRSTAYRERIRDRRKRHTTDNAYHSMLKTMLEEDEQQNPNYILSYHTTLDPITDSESLTSIHHQQQKQKSMHTNSHHRVPINGTSIPIITEHKRLKQRQYSSSISSRDSSSDTDITTRHPTVWERLPSNSIYLQRQPDRFIPINPLIPDTNNHQTMSHSNNRINSSPFDNVNNYQINNQTSSIRQDSIPHHVSLCVNDLRTTLYIDENTLNNNNHSKTMNNGGKVVIKTFIDRIIKRLQHFKRSLDNGLIHVRKRNTLVNESIISTDEMIKTNINSIDDNKLIRPYFLIRPQTLLLLPNETAKFKCCFGGDPLPNLIWSHNESRISEILTATNGKSSRYQIHKLHDIYYLNIGSVNLNDNGQIKCTIMNKYGREEAIAQLIVVSSPADAIPCITQPLYDITIIEGQPLKLSCGINGLQVIVNWFHNGKLISPTTQLKSDYYNENTIFTLSCCMKTDAGTIDCIVKNRFGETRTSCHIEVINNFEFDR